MSIQHELVNKLLYCVVFCYRKLRHTVDEYTTRVGQQAVVLCCTPGKSQSMQMYKVFGSQPLENVVSCLSAFKKFILGIHLN